MQKPLNAVNLLSPAAPPAARPKNGAPDNDGAQFTQALQREVAQRQEAAKPVKQATAADAPPKQAPVKADKTASAKPAAPAEQERKPQVKGKQEDADASAAAAAAADAGQVSPMVDMLALVASLRQPQQASAQVASEPAAATGGGAGQLEGQLAALQAAAAGAPAAEADATPGGGDGKFFNMMARMETGVEESAAPMKPELLTKAEPQARAAADPAAVLTRGAPEIIQVVRRDDAPRVMQADAPAAPLSAAVQQTSLAVAQAVNVAAGDKIPARVGTPGWDNQVAQKVIYMVGGQDMSASLTLNPPDLGPMQVVLKVTNDHADVTFTSAQPEVRQALEDAMPKLREMMGESGISLGNASVNDGAQQQAQEQAAAAAERGRGARATNGSAAEAEAELTARTTRTVELPGIVNTFA